MKIQSAAHSARTLLCAALGGVALIGWAARAAAAVPEPVFQLRAKDGRIEHGRAAADRKVEIRDVAVQPSGRLQDVLVFNGKTSRMEYDPHDWPELKVTGDLTYHVRARLAHPGSEQFILGCFSAGFVTAPEGWPQGNASPREGRFHPANSRVSTRADRFYDIFLRIRLDHGDTPGCVSTSVYDPDSGAFLGQNRSLLRTFDHMRLGEAPFAIGQGGRYAPFAGEIAAANVWNSWLSDTQIEEFLRTPNGLRRQQIAVRDDLRDARASARWREWLSTRERYPIAAWGYFQRYKGDEEEYRVYRDANFTMVMAPLGTAANAEKVGLDTILGLWGDNDKYLELYHHPEFMAEFVRTAQSRLHRVAGYMLADEPRYNGPAIADLPPGFEYLYAHESKALPVVNLMTYPYNQGGGYEEYVERFIRATHPPFLVTDCYILFRDNRSNDDTFYANNEVIRRKALEADIGFMGFALNTGHGRPAPSLGLRTASESDLHWQVNVMLAYGAQGIWYYNYRISPREGFEEGLVTHQEGRPTRNYDYVRRLNGGVLANGALLMKLRSVNVFHVPPVSEVCTELTRPYADGAIRGLSRLRASDVIAAELAERDAPAEHGPVYVMLVNRRHAENAAVDDPALQTSVSFELEPGYRAELIDSDTGVARAIEPSGLHSLSLGGGARALLRLTAQ